MWNEKYQKFLGDKDKIDVLFIIIILCPYIKFGKYDEIFQKCKNLIRCDGIDFFDKINNKMWQILRLYHGKKISKKLWDCHLK